MQQTPYSAAADMNTTNASAVDISMAGVGGNRGTYSFRDSKEVFRGVGLESKMKLFGSLAGGIGSMPSDFEFSGDGVSDYSKKSVIENGSGEGAAEEDPDGQAGGGEGAGHAEVHPGKEVEEQVLADPVLVDPVLVVETID